MNGHFAAVGEKATPEQYEHGVQVIDENKEFKYAVLTAPTTSVLTGLQLEYLQLSGPRKSHPRRLQLPSDLCLRFSEHRQIDLAQPLVQDVLRRHVRKRTSPDYEGYLDVQEQARGAG